MKKINLALLAILFLLSACNQDQLAYPNDCYSEEEALTETERNQVGDFKKIYRYNGEMYSVYVCFDCYIIPIAVGCDGKNLCEINNTVYECMDDFFKEATYLFSVNVN